MTSYTPTYREYIAVNKVDEIKAANIANSIINQGWKGLPILTCGTTLITGSHRLEALNIINERYNNEDINFNADDLISKECVFEDITDLIEAYAEREDISVYDVFDNFEYDNLRKYFTGTWLEKHKDELVEW